MNHVTQPSCFADISIFSLKISRFCYIKKYRQIAISFIISNSFNFFEALKIIIKNMVTILRISAKMVTQGLLKTRVF